MGKKKEFTTNKYYARIVKCCASCIHNKGMVSETTRVCDDGEGVVSLKSLCGNWAMNPNLEKAGLGGGRIKKKKYFKFLMDFEKPEGKFTTTEIVNMTREAFKKKHGSIYVDI